MAIIRSVTTVSMLLLGLPGLLFAQALDRPMKSREDVEEAMDRALLSNCDPVSVSVSVDMPGFDDDEQAKIELALREDAKSTLQTAGIWSASGTPNLAIRMFQNSGTDGPENAVLISVTFHKPATDDYGNRHMSVAWAKSQMALPLSKAYLTLEIVPMTVRVFALTYLRINLSKCSQLQ